MCPWATAFSASALKRAWMAFMSAIRSSAGTGSMVIDDKPVSPVRASPVPLWFRRQASRRFQSPCWDRKDFLPGSSGRLGVGSAGWRGLGQRTRTVVDHLKEP